MLNIQLKVFAILIMLCIKINGSAQTSGPSQPEVQSFQPVSITNLVEKSTGQFQYSIPLFTIGGYPININYNSSIGMDNEASMIGFGFNLNGGAITRQLRGLPDDFNGDEIIRKINMKPNVTVGVDLGLSLEIVGVSKAKKKTNNYGLTINNTTGLFCNNYTGWGIENRVGAGFHGNLGGLSGNAGIGINSNSQHGTSINPYVGLSYDYTKIYLKQHAQEVEKEKKYMFSARKCLGSAANISFNSISYSPKVDFPFKTISLDFSIKASFASSYVAVGGDIRGYRVIQELETREIKNPAYGFLYAQNGKDIENASMDFARENDGVMTESKPNLPFAYATQDIYSVSGQGVSGQFELKRNNVFIGFDPKMSTTAHSGGAEIELGFGPLASHIGAEIRYGYTLNTSEKWGIKSNKLLDILDFNAVGNSPVAEQVYFKNPNDIMFNDNSTFNLTTYNPIAPKLKNIVYYGGQTKPDKISLNGQTIGVSSSNFVNTTRHNR
jgi:hypothetical protein